MYFNKNEIIELFGGKKCIVAETEKYENTYFYYVMEINKEENEVYDNYKIITTRKENGNLFIQTVKGEKEATLKSIFDKKISENKERNS